MRRRHRGYPRWVNHAVADSEASPVRAVGRVAHPLPLGFLGLAVASFAFATVQLGWIGVAQGSTVALSVLFFTVPVQLLASVAGFLRAELAPATRMAGAAGPPGAVAPAAPSPPPGRTTKGVGGGVVGGGGAPVLPPPPGPPPPPAA